MKETVQLSQFRCRNLTLDLTSPKIMGILNATPDSFSDGGLFFSVDAAMDQIGKMVEEKASIIDIGGESTRPGSDPVSEQEEIDRVLPVFEKAIPLFPEVIFSVDTTKYEVARLALEAGTHMINDVSGLQKEPRLMELAATYNAAFVLMHSQGNPKSMQNNPSYRNVIDDIRTFFRLQLKHADEHGVTSVLLDPGIGFGKTMEHNLELVARLKEFNTLGYPLLVGASRKSMIGTLLDGRPADDRLHGTLAVHYHCMMNSAKVIRVHDVKAAADTIAIFNAVFKFEN
jgi:dihydropteroate synthase